MRSVLPGDGRCRVVVVVVVVVGHVDGQSGMIQVGNGRWSRDEGREAGGDAARVPYSLVEGERKRRRTRN